MNVPMNQIAFVNKAFAHNASCSHGTGAIIAWRCVQELAQADIGALEAR